MFREAAQHANDIHDAFPGIIHSLIPVFDMHCIPQRHSDLKADASIQNLLTHAMENATVQEIHNSTNKTSLSKRIHAMSDPLARRFHNVLGNEPQTTLLSNLNSQLFYRRKFNLHAESSKIPMFCACGAQFTPDHSFSCHILRADTNKPDNVLHRLSPVESCFSMTVCTKEGEYVWITCKSARQSVDLSLNSIARSGFRRTIVETRLITENATPQLRSAGISDDSMMAS